MKKAQAAMEFLMTYGWTILVIIIAGGALVYFDVLNPGKFLPDSCSIEGFLCTDFKVDSNDAELYLTNNVGDDINITEISLGTATNDTGMIMQLGASQRIVIDVEDLVLIAGSRFKETLKIEYTTTTSGISHTNSGEIITNIES